MQEAEERSRAAESAAAATAVEARTAASEWLRGQVAALRQEGEAKARQQAREAAAEAEQRAAERTEAQLAQQADRLRAESDTRVAKEVAAAREGAEREARETYRIREEEIERAKAAIEGELAATRRQLDEAHDRALAAERRATQIESETAREVERERELRFKAIEGRIGEVTDMASGATERARATDVGPAPASTPAAPPAVEAPDPEPEPEAKPRTPRRRSSRKPKADADEKEPEPGLIADGTVNLSTATYDDLRGLGLSVTQAKRILDFRARLGGFDSVDDLDYVPGFPKSLLTALKDRVTL